MATCPSVTSKICLTVIGFVFWAAAAGLIFLGAWVYHTYHHFSELTTANLTLIPAAIVISVGVFLFIIGSLGCIAACKENKCLLAVFFSLLLIVLTAEVVAGALGYVFREDMKKAVDNGLKEAIDKYDYDGSVWQNQIDYLQKELHCCGIYNSSDWGNAKKWNRTDVLPKSCCKPDLKHNCSNSTKSHDHFTKGCVTLLEDKFLKNLVYIAGTAIAFAVIQLLGMICSCILLCRSSEVRYEMLGGPNSGLRV